MSIISDALAGFTPSEWSEAEIWRQIQADPAGYLAKDASATSLEMTRVQILGDPALQDETWDDFLERGHKAIVILHELARRMRAEGVPEGSQIGRLGIAAGALAFPLLPRQLISLIKDSRRAQLVWAQIM